MSRIFTFVIDEMGNEALEGFRDQEVSRLLSEVSEKVADGFEGGILKDGNGNTVGTWGYRDAED